MGKGCSMSYIRVRLEGCPCHSCHCSEIAWASACWGQVVDDCVCTTFFKKNILIKWALPWPTALHPP